jgi:hypothetical protein
MVPRDNFFTRQITVKTFLRRVNQHDNLPFHDSTYPKLDQSLSGATTLISIVGLIYGWKREGRTVLTGPKFVEHILTRESTVFLIKARQTNDDVELFLTKITCGGQTMMAFFSPKSSVVLSKIIVYFPKLYFGEKSSTSSFVCRALIKKYRAFPS